ncbi:lipopolysaccharide biosynthesis protein rffA [Enterobacter cloacae]|uniref:Lipopolysaccharide biosynthesis protein rffA n=1 Tax=Enterobacter cloacae TaxID=550 RepID=A0A377LQP4_ENTCL|nr:lipopolysaccharide biosynthesis protein rffA [Enterobacter cloacae]
MIPFNAPPVVGTELDYMQSAMGSGKLCGDGGFTRRCQQWMEQRFHSAKVLLTPSLYGVAGNGCAVAGYSAR